MKKIYALLSIGFLCSSAQSQTLSWGNEITVASSATHGSLRPRIVLDGSSEPLILWGQGTGNNPIWMADWTGSGFGTPYLLLPSAFEPYMEVWTGADMASKGDTIYVVFKREV